VVKGGGQLLLRLVSDVSRFRWPLLIWFHSHVISQPRCFFVVFVMVMITNTSGSRFSITTRILAATTAFFFLALLGLSAGGQAVHAASDSSKQNGLVRNVHASYANIFTTGNRNAASHKWVSHVLAQGAHKDDTSEMMTAFCAVSGSPVRPSDYSRYLLRLPVAGDENLSKIAGFMYYCCWPCVCDTEDFLSVDTLTVDGEEPTYFAAMADPCSDPSKLHEPFRQPFGGRTTTLARDAPEVSCDDDGKLVGATYTDHGLIAIGGFWPVADDELVDEHRVSAPQPGRVSSTRSGVSFQDEREYDDMCYERELNGHDSGMGEIFRRVAAIGFPSGSRQRCRTSSSATNHDGSGDKCVPIVG